MVGPSSSHTAGACKIGQFARALFHGSPTDVKFYLHGSFGEVYKGHATDRALLAGVMKLRTSDPRIKDAFKIAKQKEITYEFIPKDLGKKYHPNTVKVVLKNSRRQIEVTGSSVGGGIIEIVKIDDFDILLKGRAGKYLSIIACHKTGVHISRLMVKKVNHLKGVKVAAVSKTNYGGKTLSIISLEGKRRITISEIVKIEKSHEGIEFMRSLSKLEKQ